MGLSSFYSELMKGLGASTRIFSLLEAKQSIEIPKGKTLTPIRGKIEFTNVSFTYPTRQDVPIFSNLTFTVEPGMNVAFVGHSGSGKSSIAQLLLRYYDPIDGKITIDGVDLKELDIEWWRRDVVGMVSQEPVLFASSIRDNIAYGSKNEISDKDIELAAQQANALGFIQSFPNSFDTFVGERGSSISGGRILY